jgi:hypothetical protein
VNLLDVVGVPNIRNDDMCARAHIVKKSTRKKVITHVHTHDVRHVNHGAPGRNTPSRIHNFFCISFEGFDRPAVQGHARILDGLGQATERIPLVDERGRNRIFADSRPTNQTDDHFVFSARRVFT